MTAPAIDIETVENIDLTPVCEDDRHADGDRPPADFWIDQHGCSESFDCAACLAYHKAFIERLLADGRPMYCDGCHKRFMAFEQAVTKVVPL